MSNEKITEEELLGMLNEHELSDEDIAAIAGGGHVEYVKCVREKLDNNDLKKPWKVIRNECKHLK